MLDKIIFQYKHWSFCGGIMCVERNIRGGIEKNALCCFFE